MNSLTTLHSDRESASLPGSESALHPSLAPPTPAPDRTTVLIVDDDEGLLFLMDRVVRREGFTAVTASSGALAINWLADHAVDLMLLDMKLPDMTGRQVLSHLEEQGLAVPFIVITGEGDERLAVDMMRCGALDYLVKDSHFLDFLPNVVNRSLTHLNQQKLLASAEQELKKQHAFNASVIQASGAIMLIADAEGRLVRWNKAGETITGWSSNEVMGRPFWELFGLAGGADFANTSPCEFEGSLLTRGGECRLVAWSITTLHDQGGAVEFIIASGIDITERKRLEADAIAASTTAAAKDLFFGMVSHELRTPLTPLFMLLSDLAATPGRSAEDLAAFAVMRQNLELETQIVDDLLDLNRATSGKLELQCETVELHHCLSSAIEICRNDVGAKGLHLKLELTAASPFVSGDARRLQQVFWNLIKNAVKFTPPSGTITIGSYDNADAQVIIEVRDTGIGMDAGSLGHIFDPFFQAAPARKQRVGGLGLGLAICKAITEAHGGALTAASAGLNQGTVFRLVLPAVAAPPLMASPTPRVDASRRQDLRLLVVEDHDDSRRVLARLLTRRGYQVKAACGLTEALAFCAEDGSFDLFITDLELQGETGYEVLQKLGAKHGLRGISMSGSDVNPKRAEGEEPGFLAHIVKPIGMEALDAAIQQAVARLSVCQG